MDDVLTETELDQRALKDARAILKPLLKSVHALTAADGTRWGSLRMHNVMAGNLDLLAKEAERIRDRVPYGVAWPATNKWFDGLVKACSAAAAKSRMFASYGPDDEAVIQGFFEE